MIFFFVAIVANIDDDAEDEVEVEVVGPNDISVGCGC
jgi:hypothetical protein